MSDRFRRLLCQGSGVTLVETLVALGIMSMAMGLIGSSIFQSLSIEKFWLDDVIATREARHAGSWLSGDALNAEEVCDPSTGAELAPGAYTGANSVTLVWYDVQDPAQLPAAMCTLAVDPGVYTIHVATYSQSGNDLLRTLTTDGVQTSELVLSQRVDLARFVRSATGDVISMELDVEAERGSTEQLTLDTFLRRLRG